MRVECGFCSISLFEKRHFQLDLYEYEGDSAIYIGIIRYNFCNQACLTDFVISQEGKKIMGHFDTIGKRKVNND